MRRSFFIAGGGFFGSKALHEASKYASVVLIADVEGKCLASRDVGLVISLEELSGEHFKKFKSILVVGEASDALSRVIRLGFKPEVVVPAIPRHFAADFLKHELKERGFKALPSPDGVDKALKSFPRELVLSLSLENAMFTSSYMPPSSRCAIPCAQPGICPSTGRLRSKPMFEVIREAMHFADLALVLESKRIGDFSGGFEFEALWSFISKVEVEASNRSIIVALATACKCHGVANFFKVASRP